MPKKNTRDLAKDKLEDILADNPTSPIVARGQKLAQKARALANVDNTAEVPQPTRLNPVPSQTPTSTPQVQNNPASAYWANYNNNPIAPTTPILPKPLPKPTKTNTPSMVMADGSVNPPIPSTTYTPENGQEWRNWWNWQAAHPAESKVLLTMKAISEGQPDPFAVHVPTPQEVWNMKAAQRAKMNANKIQDGTGEGFSPTSSPAPVVPADYQDPYPGYSNQPLFGYGNQVISASWRING